jgi:hypothetical protein
LPFVRLAPKIWQPFEKAIALNDGRNILTQQLEILKVLSKSYQLVLKASMPHDIERPNEIDSTEGTASPGAEMH